MTTGEIGFKRTPPLTSNFWVGAEAPTPMLPPEVILIRSTAKVEAASAVEKVKDAGNEVELHVAESAIAFI